MTLTTHALTGAVIGNYFTDPIAIIFFSIFTHYAIDTFRHGEYLNRKSTWKDTSWKVLLDLSIGIILVSFLIFQDNQSTNISNISLAVFFSLLPDFITLLYWKLGFKKLKFLYTLHTNIHPHQQDSPERKWIPRNLINDLLISTIAVILFLLSN
ncbi:hypothetical protein ACFL2R_01060 [Patescibacteria group bacterium]